MPENARQSWGMMINCEKCKIISPGEAVIKIDGEELMSGHYIREVPAYIAKCPLTLRSARLHFNFSLVAPKRYILLHYIFVTLNIYP